MDTQELERLNGLVNAWEDTPSTKHLLRELVTACKELDTRVKELEKKKGGK